ncbi:CmpA/NrtA family ABC transporter substrate-binding protein [Henriciella aquimarina]|uniref:CmpA/NrtA family ABC transporter substrate-binding protein n=1 Tax=Henriciella aquimarina TaxID=545261 RepID=UPI000A04E192|nr:CmpA/NrtA family ABC transporter substrate-binding protein [Henriciella aquimarina]
MASRTVRIGFIPLSDAAPLIIAKHEGLFEALGLEVTLSREHSWARIRDKLAVGGLDAAHLLSPMVVASALGLSPMPGPLATAFAFNLNGNGITVSNALFKAMQAHGPDAFEGHPVSADALRYVALDRLEKGQPPLTLAMVYPFSSHNYLLRYWLGAAGLHPDRDVRLIVVPPPDMVRLCEADSIDGFCVGEPWNTLAQHTGIGHRIVAGADIWPAAPEKVLGVKATWMEENAETHLLLIRALLRANQRLMTEDGRRAAAQLLSEEQYIGIGTSHIAPSLTGSEGPEWCSLYDPTFATFPWLSKAIWTALQMVRWGQLTEPVGIEGAVERAFRTDIYRHAALLEHIPSPAIDSVIEGGSKQPRKLMNGKTQITLPADHIMDGKPFNPALPDRYLEQFFRHSIRLKTDELFSE